ncbi:hypothetical protein HKX48_001081 [Thoreauomyces humboldtii]|nr:hypothetical protein HKX48_001081 [Thoreauomyces humboldtii]
MALKIELTQWVEGVRAFETKDFDRSLDLFLAIADTSKIHFNIAMAFINMGSLNDAIAALGRSVACDPFLAVSYFMRGVCFYNANALEESLADFNDALTYLRGNTQIDYAQLGLSFKLFSCEVSFNRGLCLAAMGQVDEAFKDFDDAARSRPPASESSQDFANIDEAMKLGDRAPEFLGPYSVAPDVVYRPPTGRVKNIDVKDYMGKAKVVASVEATDNYAGFSGAELKRKNTLPRSNSANDIPTLPRGGISRANTSMGVMGRSATVSPAPTTRDRIVGGGVAPPTINRPLRNRSSSLGDFQPLPRVPIARAISVNPIDELMADLGGPDDGYASSGSNGYGGGAGKTRQQGRAVSPVGSSTSTVADKIKLKAHYKTTRILLLPPIMQLGDMLDRLQDKFGLPREQAFRINYKDEDGSLVTIFDQEDLEVAYAVQGVEWGEAGRVEFWIEEA